MTAANDKDHRPGTEQGGTDEDLPEGVVYADPGHGGGEYLYRVGELLVAAGDVEQCEQELERREQRWRRSPLEGDEKPYVRLVVEPTPLSVPELVSQLRSVTRLQGGTLDCNPEHVVVGFGHRRPGKGASCPPRPTPVNWEMLAPTSTASLGGTGVTVAQLDSGYLAGHTWLDGRVKGTEETPSQDSNDRLRAHSGHGTFVAGVILQHAPGANVLSIAVFDDHGTVTDSALADALRALPAEVDIINLSLGGPTHGNAGLPATASALAWLRQRNPHLVVVAAAGNDADPTPNFPAAEPSVIAVAALDAQGRPACFTNHGKWVDVCAQGVDIHSSFFTYQGPVEPVEPRPGCPQVPPGPTKPDFKGWATWSGTSFATPQVVGAIASAITTFSVSADEAALRICRPPGQPRLVDGRRDVGVAVA